MEKYTDESKMPFGKFQGDKMANVPAWNLIWLHEGNARNDKDLRQWYPQVFEYIVDNEDLLYSQKQKKENR